MDVFERYVGQIFDNRYKIEKIIGIGGMAVVYKAVDILMKRTVAVKMLKDEIANDVQSVKRFINESKAVAMLSHPNIVNIYDVSVKDNVKYIVMEYIEGITLKNYMTRRGILSLPEILSYSEQILNALAHAHAKGIIHRDIKPQNIMLLKNGIIKVMDFGIAKLPNAETVTMTDKAIGTVYYISPEQASGKQIDRRSDLYSLGVLMYEMSTGQLPFTADSPVSVALMQVNDIAVKPREINPEIPIGLEQIISRAMEKEPDVRFSSAEEMLKQLIKLKENPRMVFRQPNRKRKTDNIKSSKPTDKSNNEAPQKVKRHSQSMLPIILGVAVSFLIVAGISAYNILSTLIFSGELDKSKTLTVHEFEGSYYTDELSEWFKKSSEYNLELKYVYDPEYEPGIIISQSPSPGEKRKVIPGRQKCDIVLTVSQGNEKITLPDLTMYEYREAEQSLRDLGLVVEKEQVYHDTIEIGYVVTTEPNMGTVMSNGDTVKLYISKGAEIKYVVVPNFVGLDEVEAMRELLEFNLTVGDVSYQKSDKDKGIVLEQSVAAFTKAEQKTPINFVISSGPDGVLPSGETYVAETIPEETTVETMPETTEETTAETIPETIPETEPETVQEETTAEIIPEETTVDIFDPNFDTDYETWGEDTGYEDVPVDNFGDVTEPPQESEETGSGISPVW